MFCLEMTHFASRHFSMLERPPTCQPNLFSQGDAMSHHKWLLLGSHGHTMCVALELGFHSFPLPSFSVVLFPALSQLSALSSSRLVLYSELLSSVTLSSIYWRFSQELTVLVGMPADESKNLARCGLRRWHPGFHALLCQWYPFTPKAEL